VIPAVLRELEFRLLWAGLGSKAALTLAASYFVLSAVILISLPSVRAVRDR
jgi:hypothetical protein